MKRILSGLFLVAILFTAQPVYAEDLASRITSVIIYPGSAMITRSGSMDLVPGEHQVVLADIIPNIDENSLKVSGEGPAGMRILGAQVKREFLTEAASEQVKKLEAEMLAVRDELRIVADEKNVAEHKKMLLDSLLTFSKTQLPEEMATKMPLAKDVGDMVAFLGSSFKDYYSVFQALDIKERELNKKLDALQREWGEFARSPKMKRSVVVEVAVQKEGKVCLQVSYLVAGAVTWVPVYEARASFEKSNVELSGFGIVRQSTGEDWTDVNVILSTAQPTVSGRMPEFSSWILREDRPEPRQYEPYYMDKSVADVAAPRQSNAAFFGMAGAAKAKEETIMEKARVETAVAENKGMSVSYKIPRKATIKSDNSEERLPILGQTLPARFKYMAYPRANSFAYLAAAVTNDKNLQLLPGRLNVFLDGDFVATSRMDGIAPGEEFDLSLGIDESVKIKKEETARKKENVLVANIPSPVEKISITYKITAENYKGKDIMFELFDAVPVSEDQRIKSRVDKLTLEPKEKDTRNKKGIWRWEYKLGPSEKKEISYTVLMEYPRGMRVEGL